MPRRGKPDVEKIREGNRGGLGLFRWDNIKEDKHREIYLGNTVKCAVGRWQKNKNLNWFNEQKVAGESQVELDEIAEIKRKETEAMMEALGMKKSEDAVINQQDMSKIVKNELPEQVVDEKIVVGAKKHRKAERKKRDRSRSKEQRHRGRSRSRERRKEGSRERYVDQRNDSPEYRKRDYRDERGRSRSPKRGRSRSPRQGRSRSPRQGRSRSPRRERTAERKKRHSPEGRKSRQYTPEERDRKYHEKRY
ncbi:hypothetical protein HDV01_004879 [Terramyces sp. JEL0728]|nr:hypothetical protein HDV01_004879 [Terramyces sp. JEL0728]